MTKKKKGVFNPKLKTLFEEIKRDTNTTSRQIAKALGVSAQTVTSMSGKLDEISVSYLAVLAIVFDVSIEYLTVRILQNSEYPNGYNGLETLYLNKKD